jgi:LmbE family N-acetylglucosaminyl deacetylase
MNDLTDVTPSPRPEWSEIKRALIIVAHPDDMDFICGGTVIQTARLGIEWHLMVLTNGDKGNHNPAITREQLIAMRKVEQRAAAQVAGVKEVLFMNEEDGFLAPSRELRRRVVREIRRIKPELILLTNPNRYFVGDGYINHPDHRNAGLVAIEAIFPASYNPMFWPEMADEGYPPHKIKYAYVHGHEAPDVKVEVTADLAQKIDAILCHHSQFDDPAAARTRWIESWPEKQEDGSLRYYESFKLMKF